MILETTFKEKNNKNSGYNSNSNLLSDNYRNRGNKILREFFLYIEVIQAYVNAFNYFINKR